MIQTIQLSSFWEQSTGTENSDTFCFRFVWNKQPKRWVAWAVRPVMTEQMSKTALCVIDKWSLGSKLTLNHLNHNTGEDKVFLYVEWEHHLSVFQKLDTKFVWKPHSFHGLVMLWISCSSMQTSDILLLPVGKFFFFFFFLVPPSSGRSEVVISYKDTSLHWKAFTALPVDTSLKQGNHELTPPFEVISIARRICLLVPNHFAACLIHQECEDLWNTWQEQVLWKCPLAKHRFLQLLHYSCSAANSSTSHTAATSATRGCPS